MAEKNNQNRRAFLQTAGLGAAALLTAGGSQVVADDAPACTKKKSKALFKLGLASYTTRKFDLDQTLAMSKRLGLNQVCLKSFHLPLDASAEQIADAVTKVKKADMVLYGGGVIYMRNEKELKQAFDYAKAAGMTTIVGVPVPEVLPLTNELVKQYDIQVAIHNHGPGDKVYPLPQSAYEKIKDLDKRIGLCIDIGHVIRYGNDPVEAIKETYDRVLDIHLKDVTAATPKGSATVGGRGVIDLPAVLKTLVDLKYDRVASFEFEADGDDPLPGLAETAGYVRGILAVI